MQVLEQGEVFRIADASNRYYLNSLLDALFPALDERRQELIRAVKKHTALMEHFAPEISAEENTRFETFASSRMRELDRLRVAAGARLLDPDTRQIVESLVQHAQSLHPEKIPATLWTCLSGVEDWFWHLYLAQAGRFIERSKGVLRRLPYVGDSASEEKLAKLWIPGDEPATPWDGDVSDTDTQDDTFEPLDEDPADLAAGWRIVERLSRGLIRRLTRLIVWRRQFRGRLLWNARLQAVAGSYATILESHIGLVELQEGTCAAVTQLLNRDGTIVRVFTTDSETAVQSAREELARVAALSAADKDLQATTWRESADQVRTKLSHYIGATQKLVEDCRRLAFADEFQQAVNHRPIDIELRQGSEYRSFTQLSFGQKSGIILKLVLSATTKRVVIIDQPEDNLDTNAIVHMLAPALKTLGQDRQVVIATHNANLIMGLADANLVALESSGDYGRILTRGSLLTPATTRAVLDILEGGAAAFDIKIKIYEQFVQQLSGQIRDMDINAIESTFRRRTIDGLRNFLQPVVSDRAMLEFFRHELRQPSRLGSHIKEVRLVLEGDASGGNAGELSTRLDRLLDTLDGHAAQLQAKIDEMRMLDTQPRKTPMRLGPLLDGLAAEYVSRFSQAFRRITIDIDPAVKSVEIFADPNHIKLVFANLFKNSLRATESRAVDALWRAEPQFREEVHVELASGDARGVIVRIKDNGCGIPTAIEPKLYRERCSDQVGTDHGLGGIIIRKILDINDGSIRVLRSNLSDGTIQELSFQTQNGGST